MNHYDDLQRFKDKTRTQNLEFKDLSAQTTAHERGEWAILEQLSPSSDEASASGLGVGGSVSQIVPQPVAADAFVPHDLPPLRPAEREGYAHEKRASSIMQSVSTQMITDPEPEAAPAPVEVPQSVVEPRAAPRIVAAPPAPAPQPAARQPAPAAAQNASYSHLFAPKTAEIVGKAEKEEKDQPLKSLLERIASCR